MVCRYMYNAFYCNPGCLCCYPGKVLIHTIMFNGHVLVCIIAVVIHIHGWEFNSFLNLNNCVIMIINTRRVKSTKWSVCKVKKVKSPVVNRFGDQWFVSISLQCSLSTLTCLHIEEQRVQQCQYVWHLVIFWTGKSMLLSLQPVIFRQVCSMSFRWDYVMTPPSPPLPSLTAIDYSVASPHMTFSNGSNASQCVNVTITKDMVVEDSENVTLSLNSTDNGTITTDTAILIITDNESMFSYQQCMPLPKLNWSLLYGRLHLHWKVS